MNLVFDTMTILLTRYDRFPHDIGCAVSVSTFTFGSSEKAVQYVAGRVAKHAFALFNYTASDREMHIHRMLMRISYRA